MKIITIKNYGSRVKPHWSVDEHFETFGNYIAQIAFWYKNRKDAILSAKKIASQDKAKFLNELGKEE